MCKCVYDLNGVRHTKRFDNSLQLDAFLLALPDDAYTVIVAYNTRGK